MQQSEVETGIYVWQLLSTWQLHLITACQRVITEHIMDVLHMPDELVNDLKKGGFALSLSRRNYHSVTLDECLEMLINKQVKQLSNSEAV